MKADELIEEATKELRMDVKPQKPTCPKSPTGRHQYLQDSPTTVLCIHCKKETRQLPEWERE